MSDIKSQLLVGNLSNDRKNNLDFIRFIAATMVIFSHSYPLSGNHDDELLRLMTNGQIGFGELGVAIFFVISGFLIAQSYERSSTVMAYVVSRCLRIFPGLFMALLFAVFIVGPLATTLPLKEYFSNAQTYEYVKSIFLYPIYWDLPGVFETNAYKGAVNGSLWTIPFEVLCYVGVAILGILGALKKRKVVLFLFILFFYLTIYGDTIFFINGKYLLGLELKTFVELSTYFLAGTMIYVYRNKLFINKHLAMISLFILFLAAFFGGFKECLVIFGSYLVIYFSFNPKLNFHAFSRYGDFSYGLYIYAFPIQQLITHYYGGKMNAFVNFLLSFVITLILAVFSWHLIEKKALKLKKKSAGLYLSKMVIPRIAFLDRGTKYRRVLYLGWIQFTIIMCIVFFYINYVNQKPSVIEFPYTKSQSIFHGGWLPQSMDEKYRWIQKSASVDMEVPSGSSKVVVKGFLPQNYTDIKQASFYINDKKTNTLALQPGQEFISTMLLNREEGVTRNLNIKIEFDNIHKSESGSNDKREMSALISRIEVN